MPNFVVAITKTGSINIEASSKEAAEEIARSIEADGSFPLDLEVNVQPAVLYQLKTDEWVQRLDEECGVSFYETTDGHYGFTGCESDNFTSLQAAIHAAVLEYHGELEPSI